MTSPQGWYPDPGGSPELRWYDGERWTEHTVYPSPPVAQSRQAVATPDGVFLASWGQRVGAYVMDALVVGVVSSVIGLPWLLEMMSTSADTMRDLEAASRSGEPQPLSEIVRFYVDFFASFLVLALIQAVVGFAYHVGQWRWRSASVGMRALGIRVRTWDGPTSQLSWRTAVRRWAAFYGIGLLGAVPLVGMAAGVYVWVAGLWPLGDDRRQGLHDKIAGTVVVRSGA